MIGVNPGSIFQTPNYSHEFEESKQPYLSLTLVINWSYQWKVLLQKQQQQRPKKALQHYFIVVLFYSRSLLPNCTKCGVNL